MVAVQKTIKVTPESTLADVLDAAASEPVVLDKDGMRFRITREDDIWEPPDPERVREVLDATAGSWSDIDADQLIAELYEERETGSRPPDRP
jgi:hypothetical protein